MKNSRPRKNTFLQNLSTAIAAGDIPFVLERVTDDVCWNIIGQQVIQGKAGAVNGTIILEDGRRWAFSDVYEFNGVKATAVREITSYAIEVR